MTMKVTGSDDFLFRCLVLVVWDLVLSPEPKINLLDDEWNHHTFATEVQERLADCECMFRWASKFQERVNHNTEEGSEAPEGYVKLVWAEADGYESFRKAHRRMVRDTLYSPRFQPTLTALYASLLGKGDYPSRHLTAADLVEAKASYVRAIDPASRSNYRRLVDNFARLSRPRMVGKDVASVPASPSNHSAGITRGLETRWKSTTAGSCTPDMVDMLANEWKDIPLVPLSIDDLPRPSGWVYLEKPLMLPCEGQTADQWGYTHRPIRAMSWHTISGPGVEEEDMRVLDAQRPDAHPLAVVLSLYSDPREGGFVAIPEDEDQPDRVFLQSVANSVQDVHQLMDEPNSELYWSEFRAQGEVQLVWDVLTFLDVSEDECRSRHGEGFIWLTQAFHALWSLMQEIAVVETVPVYGKKRNKSGKERSVSNVIVVDLPKMYRPTAERDPEFKGVLTYRFPVASHWRRLRDESGTVVKRVRVKAHIKGPADGELVVKNKVLRVRKPTVQEK